MRRSYETRNIFVAYIKKKIKQNKNLLVCCVGGTGSGKSYAVLSLANQIDRNFSIDRVLFTYTDLINISEYKSYPPGTVFIFDEASAESFQARDFMSKKNKNLSALLQTFRNRNYIIFFTSPNLKFMDKQARTLIHMTLETDKIFYDVDMCRLKIKYVVVNPLTGSVYFMYPVWKIEDQPIRVTRITVPKPPQDLIDEYEIKKREYQKKLYTKLRRDYKDDIE